MKDATGTRADKVDSLAKLLYETTRQWHADDSNWRLPLWRSLRPETKAVFRALAAAALSETRGDQ